jgi:hypothetical protein
MLTYGGVLLEMEMRQKSLEAEARQERWARLAAAGRAHKVREPGIGRMAVRLGDFVAGLRCQLQNRFASDPAATAC